MKQLGVSLAAAALVLAMSGQASVGQEGEEEVVTPRQNFIVNGSPAEEGQLPWQVALIGGSDPEERRRQFCGGSIVDPEWVLTAAHCVDNFFVQSDPNRVDIVAGTLEYAEGGQRVDAVEIIVHPNWDDPTFDFDAALIRVSEPLTVGASVRLAAAEAAVPVGFPVRVSGWGATAESAPGSPVLLFVDVPAVSKETCNGPDSYDGRITDQMLCAGRETGGFDSCQGDSGGPAVSEITEEGPTLVGVVSWGFGCARPLFFGVYTRVSSISDWVSETIAGH